MNPGERSKNKKQKVEEGIVPQYTLQDRLPETCRRTVKDHINTIYVGSIIRILDVGYSPEGQLATVHWVTNEGLFVTLHMEEKSAFVDLRYKSWVVDHRSVKPGSFKLFSRYGTNDIADDRRSHTINEIKQRNSRILSNDTLMDYPTQADRNTYSCCLFRLTCNCGCSKRAKKYTCSEKNKQNAGKRYYGCSNRYSISEDSCNFFVWESEIEHGQYVKCECGQLCKKINVSQKGLLPIYKFVCINRNNKLHPGCSVYNDS